MLRILVHPVAAVILVGTPVPCTAQLGDLLSQVKDDIVGEARSADCFARGNCGEVDQADHFSPDTYESIAVTVFDATGQFRSTGIQGMVRNIFEGQLVENGFLLAASSNSDSVQAMIAREEEAWSDQELAQLKDFVQGIDAVLVVEIQQIDVSSCKLMRNQVGTGATAYLSARWLNVDAGDIPWVATHDATVCRRQHSGAPPTEAVEATSERLARELPAR